MDPSRNAGNDATSSRIAVRLAPHLSQRANYEQGLGRETFSQLRQEILRQDEDGPVNLDENLTDIHNLICVVIKAGLEPPCRPQSRSFSSREETLAQISDCVDIIRLAIQKAPHVLHEISNPEILGRGTAVQAPLYARLISQLLSLLCMWDDVNVQERVCKTLSTICATQFKAVRLWHSARSIPTFLRACISDLLSSIECIDVTVQRASATVLYFPSSPKGLPINLNDFNLASSAFSRSKLETPAVAVKVCLQLLEVVACPLPLGSLNARPPYLREGFAWALQSLQRIWRTVYEWLQLNESLQEEKELINLVTDLAATFRKWFSYSLRLGLGFDESTAEAWLQCGYDILVSEKLRTSFDMQHILSQLLNEAILASHSSPPIGRLIEERFLQPLADLQRDGHTYETLHQSFQHILPRVLNREYSTAPQTPSNGKRPSLRRMELSRNMSSVTRSSWQDESSSEGEAEGRARKRQRLSEPDVATPGADLSQMITANIYSTIGSYPGKEMDKMGTIFLDAFSHLDQDDRCAALMSLGRLACALAGSLSIEEQNGGARQMFRCRICDCDRDQGQVKNARQGEQFNDLRRTVVDVLRLIQGSGKCRVAAMLTVRNLLMHDPDSDSAALGGSALSDFCLNSLRSSVRELRIAAGKTLPVLLREALGPDMRRNNFVIALEYLQRICEKNELAIQETCAMALRRIAEVSGDEEMNIILLRLLEYLGHANPFISGVAYTELSKLAQRLEMTPAALFRPFWRTLSVPVVKNLHNRPQMAAQLCDLLGMNVDGFLQMTEIHVHILPYLVLTRKKDIVLRIARASDGHEEKKSIFDLCKTRKNIAAILALLLIQPSSDPEKMIISILAELSEQFRGLKLEALLRSEPILLACELLKGLGDAAEGEDSKYFRALELLASATPRRASQGSSAKDNDPLSTFIEEHVLGIITEAAHAVNDFQIRQPIVEKKRNVIAIGMMVKIANGNVSVALPQICACLRAALDTEELCDHAFASWSILVTTLGPVDVEPLIDQSLAIIVKNWKRFRAESREKALQIVEHIFTVHLDVVKETFETLPTLSSIPEMQKFEEIISQWKSQMDSRTHFEAYCRRCQNENSVVVQQALKELVQELTKYEDYIHGSAINEQHDKNLVAQLSRSLLDCCAKFNTSSQAIRSLAAQCLGLVGCLDPNRIESNKDKRDMLVLSNFDRADETFDFVLFFLQNVLVGAFLSASNTGTQGFLAYAMQALLKLCNLDSAVPPRSQDRQSSESYRRWLALPEFVRNTLTPFLSSKYTVTIGAISTSCNYPLFSKSLSHSGWLRTFVLDMLQKGNGQNAKMIFSVSSRIIRNQDISIGAFLLPFAALNVAVSEDEGHRATLTEELVNVLGFPLPEHDNQARDNTILCSESVFDVLDYLSRWLQGKKKEYTSVTGPGGQNHQSHSQSLLDSWSTQMKRVEQLLSLIPAEIISRRAVECKSYARALFYWEQYIRQQRSLTREKEHSQLEPLYQRLQDIYTQIDEPDGIEGISSQLHVLNIDQQMLEHRKAGRWVAAQNWYELQLNKTPEDSDIQMNLLACLKESGQHDVLLNHFGALKTTESTLPKMLPLAMESTWITGQWDLLDKYLAAQPDHASGDFNIGVGSALNSLRKGKFKSFKKTVKELRRGVAKGFTSGSVSSFQASHDGVMKLHVLAEMEMLADIKPDKDGDSTAVVELVDRRLDMLGGCISDKQYLLGVRRAVMELSGSFDELDVASTWVRIGRLARKANSTEQAFNAVLHAAHMKDKAATIEFARLLWKEGNHRKAIRTLEGAIAANAFVSHDSGPADDTLTSVSVDHKQKQNMLTARAHLLLARWMDSAGQTQSDVIIQRYRQAIKFHSKWEKAHYYLGRHYAKILDSEKAKPLGKEAQIYLSGEAAKLVIDNYLRSLAYGNKYVFQTLPKILTLWLEHAASVDRPFDPKRGDNEDFQRHSMTQRKKSLDDMHNQLRKYISRIPMALFFTILPQVVARICHANATVSHILMQIVVKTVVAFPRQGLWTVLAMYKSSSKERASRGMSCLQKITESTKKQKGDTSPTAMKSMVNQGQKFSEELLKLCVAHIEDRTPRVSLARNLNFNHRTTPCCLVIPLEATLTPTLPSTHETAFMKRFQAFPHDAVTVETVLDEALVLNSLQKPRKISLRGSDGKIYSLLCKPKDDLRKDQRLMEFNGMINRFLKRDVESNKRRLYIKTYAVTPLNEECGLIEWVDNLRTLRELVIKLLKERGIVPNYNEIRHYLQEACSNDSRLGLFSDILSKYPPVLHDWFVEMFPELSAWFGARLRYTRSTAVMSMVGYSLGLGDRHGENILFEEGSGGVLHVDFNCLFDKGLTFDKPELVPFRLTHNMIDAFGAYGYNGPFRKTCELTLNLLRQNEDSLMTILETFLHDPTTDFIGKKKRINPRVPESPEGVLEFVRNKLRGLLPGESVPLSVGGHVDELIIEATSIKNLASMYIGWCAFF